MAGKLTDRELMKRRKSQMSATDLLRIDFSGWRPNYVEPPPICVNPARFNRRNFYENEHREPPNYVHRPVPTNKRYHLKKNHYSHALEQQQQLATSKAEHPRQPNQQELEPEQDQRFDGRKARPGKRTEKYYGQERFHHYVLPTAKRQKILRFNHPSISHQPYVPPEPKEEKEAVFCVSVRFFEKKSKDDEDSKFSTRDTQGRLFKVQYIGYEETRTVEIKSNKLKQKREHEFYTSTYEQQQILLQEELIQQQRQQLQQTRISKYLQSLQQPDSSDQYELDFGENLVDLRETDVTVFKSKFEQDKLKVLKYLDSFVNGPEDLVNLRRARSVILSMQMYDDVDGLVLPAEISLAEFNLQNGVIDFFHSYMEPLHRLNAVQRQRLNSAALNGLSLDSEPYTRLQFSRPFEVYSEILHRLNPLESMRKGTFRGPYKYGFREFVRSAVPNLTTEFKQFWELTDHAPILTGNFNARWIIVLDHEYETIIKGLRELARIYPMIECDLKSERFVMASAYMAALGEFANVEGDAEAFEQISKYGTEAGSEIKIPPPAMAQCNFHTAHKNFHCSRNSVIGFCYTMEHYFRSHFGNDLLPEKEKDLGDLDEEFEVAKSNLKESHEVTNNKNENEESQESQ